MLILHTKHAFSFKCHFVKSFYIYLFVIAFLIVHVFDIVLNTMNIFDLFLSLLIVTIIIFYNYCISFYLRCVLQTPCSVVTSPNGKWARCSPWWLPGCEGSRTKTTPSLLRFLLFLSTDHGRVRTGNRPEPSRNRSHRTFTFLPPFVSLVTEPHLREPQMRPSLPVCCWCLLKCSPRAPFSCCSCAVLCNSALFCSARRESVTGQQ